MRSLVDVLANYAAYHRDRRNVATHAVGIPLIVLALAVLGASPALVVGGVHFTIAFAGALAVAVYYFRLDIALGAIMSLLLFVALALGAQTAAWPMGERLALGFALFVIGWIFQFVGHWCEGRKPAFLDDVLSLAVGPLFVACEGLFLLGWRPELKVKIAARAQIAP